MGLRGIRGATVADSNTTRDIVFETKTLLSHLIEKNKIDIEDIASVFFSVTPDLNAEFPAVAARELGLNFTPLLCVNEIAVPHGLPRCIRILIHVNSSKSQKEMIHLYLKAAESLRPDCKSEVK